MDKPIKKTRTLLYIFDHSDWRSRLPVAIEAQKQGWDVTIGIMGKLTDQSILKGFKTTFIPQQEARLNPFSVLKTILNLRKTIKNTNPDLIHSVTLKYSFFTGLANIFHSEYQSIYTLAGLGFLFRSTSTAAKIIRIYLSPLLKLVFLNKNAKIIFQNHDNMQLMIDMKYVHAHGAYLIKSSGVNLQDFTATNLPNDDHPLVLMPTRLVHEKGVQVFVDAARILKSRGINARFEIAGGETKHNPRAITKSEMEHMTADGAARWIGRIHDMPALFQKASIIVYPSYYGEGVPRVLLEACASARPIITTNSPGCRETVIEGKNGYLTPIKDPKSTADAIEILIKNKKIREKMGKESRKIAESEFSIKKITKNTVNLYKK